MNTIFTAIAECRASLHPLAWAALVLCGGWAVAFAIRFGLARGLRMLRFETFSTRIGLTEFLRKGGAKRTPSGLVGWLAYWIVLAAVFIRISRILDITVVQELTQQIRVIVPSALAAVLIIIVGLVLVTFLSTFALTLARNAAMAHARGISLAVRVIGIGLVAAVALDQIGFGKTILGPMLLMAFGATAFGLALAFGLGCKDMARQAMERLIRELRERNQAVKGPDLEG